MSKNVIVVRTGNVTVEGVALETNVPAVLKGTTLPCKKHWVSWDKIGEALFDDYTEEDGVAERDELRTKP